MRMCLRVLAAAAIVVLLFGVGPVALVVCLAAFARWDASVFDPGAWSVLSRFLAGGWMAFVCVSFWVAATREFSSWGVSDE